MYRLLAAYLLPALLLGTVALAQAPAPVPEKKIGEPPPQAEQILTPQLPGFTLVNQEMKADRRLFEFVPKNETQENWTERVAIIVFLGVTGKDPKQVAETLQADWRKTCATFSSHPVEMRWEKGYPTSVFAMQCADSKPAQGRLNNEFVMAKIIQGIDSLYLVQRAWHSAKDKVPPPLRDTKTGDNWANFIKGVEVCDARLRGQPCAALGVR
jgi:hypothetical protein